MEELVWANIEPEFMVDGIDPKYEFDAPRYFDFAIPESDGDEAETWFNTAASCPPSRLFRERKMNYSNVSNGRYSIRITKLNFGKLYNAFVMKLTWNPLEFTYPSKKAEGEENTESIRNNSDISMGTEAAVIDKKLYSQNDMAQDILKFKIKAVVKSSLSSTTAFMRPTASYLAKQNQRREVYSGLNHGRSQKGAVKIDENLPQKPSAIESQALKRQKLNSGFLHKVANLKNHNLLHKVSKKVDISSSCARQKVTIPREPNLETAQRAQRHRSTSTLKHEHIEIDGKFKAQPLNIKILSRRGELGVFQNTNQEGMIPKESKLTIEKRFECDLATELFSKLSITSNSKTDTVSQPLTKGLKENVPVSRHQEHGVS